MKDFSYTKWFDDVYTETYPTIRRCAFAFLKLYPDLKGEAEDLIQETYIRMFKMKDKLFMNDEVIKWLVVTLRNLVSNRVRVRGTANKYSRWDIDRDQVFENTYADPASSVDEIFMNEEESALRKIADHIGEDKLELLQEYYIDKVSLQELARREGISTDAMKMRISRLRKKCIEVLLILIMLNALLSHDSLHIGGGGNGDQSAAEILLRKGSTQSNLEGDIEASRYD